MAQVSYLPVYSWSLMVVLLYVSNVLHSDISETVLLCVSCSLFNDLLYDFIAVTLPILRFIGIISYYITGTGLPRISSIKILWSESFSVKFRGKGIERVNWWYKKNEYKFLRIDPHNVHVIKVHFVLILGLKSRFHGAGARDLG